MTIPAPDARLAELVSSARATLADVFARYRCVFLAFSGGKDSLTVLHLCESWRDRLTLLWTNTGHMAPFMVEFVRSHADRYHLVELAPARPMAEQWAEHGQPADILPLEHMEHVDWRAPRLQPWLLCCEENRTRPLSAYMHGVAEPCAFLSGQRKSDRGTTPERMTCIMPLHVESVMPIWDWTTADTLTYVADHGICLHQHHDECPTSIECICCPANLSAEKLRLLDRLHPEAAVGIRTRARGALSLAAAKANEIVGVLDGTGLAAREINR
jgi:3'-phosphoadenosine 5'-phosphosulfate sulfotransferase (PAPS reductase)/FAD synthetase